MTREHKLALIVGFSLVLLVGVLIADHLSLARRAQIAPVGESELRVARGPSLIGGDLPRAAEVSVPVLSPPVPEPSLSDYAGNAIDAAGPVELPAVTAHVPLETEPVQIMQGTPRESTPLASFSDSALVEQVRQMGGSIRERGGVLEILPPAAEMNRPAQQPVREVQSSVPTPNSRSAVVPQPTPSSPRASQAASAKSYIVQKGDTYTKIAAKHYGTSQMWRELAKFNGAEDGVLILGATIKLPPQEVLTGKSTTAAVPLAKPAVKPEPKRAEPPAKPSRVELAMTHTVRKGETLGDIALQKLGTSRRWKELAEYNDLDDPDHVPAGTVLKLPPMRG